MAQVEVYRVQPADVDERSGRAVLHGDEAHHLLRVRRARPGDGLMLIDGDGCAWPATLLEATEHEAVCSLGDAQPQWREPALRVHLGLALLKGDHLLDAVDTCTQAGVHEITPLVSQRSIAGFKPNKAKRAEARALTAAKQCGRGRVPRVHPVQRLAEWSIQIASVTHKLVLDPAGAALPVLEPGAEVAVAIGPEGGFSDAELQALETRGFVRATLGPRRFRAEVAALVAVNGLVMPAETGGTPPGPARNTNDNKA